MDAGTDHGDEASPLRNAGRGAAGGAVVGLVSGGIIELATYATLQMSPIDVGIFGLGLYFGPPAAVVVGPVCWWRNWPRFVTWRLLLAALPVIALGTFQVVLQRSVQ